MGDGGYFEDKNALLHLGGAEFLVSLATSFHRPFISNPIKITGHGKKPISIFLSLPIMAEETTSVANINLDMLDRAATSEGRTPSVMDNIHTFKIYNPAPNTKAEAEKAGKFSLKAANTGTETFVEGVFKFNILDVSYFYSGSIYPLLDNGAYGEDKIFFFTNEFGKFAKKVDTI